MERIGARLLGHTRRLLFGIGAALCVAALALTGSLERWEHLWLDQLFELRGVRPPTAPMKHMQWFHRPSGGQKPSRSRLRPNPWSLHTATG